MLAFWLVFLGLDFAIWNVYVKTIDANGCNPCIVCFRKPATSDSRSYSKLLTYIACSSRAGEYRPSVVFVQNSHRSTLGQYFPVQPLRSVGKRFYYMVVSRKDCELTNLRVCGYTRYWPRSRFFHLERRLDCSTLYFSLEKVAHKKYRII